MVPRSTKRFHKLSMHKHYKKIEPMYVPWQPENFATWQNTIKYNKYYLNKQSNLNVRI